MAFDNHVGANKLAQTLQKRMSEMQPKNLILDFGSIESDYGLVTNTFPVKIPSGEYTVCRHVSGDKVFGGIHEGHSSGDGSHEHFLPGLQPGNRVLVAWVHNEAVVIDVIA